MTACAGASILIGFPRSGSRTPPSPLLGFARRFPCPLPPSCSVDRPRPRQRHGRRGRGAPPAPPRLRHADLPRAAVGRRRGGQRRGRLPRSARRARPRRTSSSTVTTGSAPTPAGATRPASSTGPGEALHLDRPLSALEALERCVESSSVPSGPASSTRPPWPSSAGRRTRARRSATSAARRPAPGALRPRDDRRQLLEGERCGGARALRVGALARPGAPASSSSASPTSTTSRATTRRSRSTNAPGASGDDAREHPPEPRRALRGPGRGRPSATARCSPSTRGTPARRASCATRSPPGRWWSTRTWSGRRTAATSSSGRSPTSSSPCGRCNRLANSEFRVARRPDHADRGRAALLQQELRRRDLSSRRSRTSAGKGRPPPTAPRGGAAAAEAAAEEPGGDPARHRTRQPDQAEAMAMPISTSTCRSGRPRRWPRR